MSPSQKLDISALLQQTDKAGVYAAENDAAHLAFNTAASLGLNAYRIDLSLANNEQELFKIFSHSLRFPDWFGNNWDALADCLGDLSWNEADGYLMLLQRTDVLQHSAPKSLNTLFQVLRDTADFWREEDIPFWVLVLDPPQKLHPKLPPLPLSAGATGSAGAV